MTRQVRSRVIAALAVFAFAGTAAPSFAEIVYNVTNYAAGQNDWSLAGTITVSGIGNYSGDPEDQSVSAITAWYITATKVNSPSWVFANNEGVSPRLTLFAGTIEATSSELLLNEGAWFRLFSQSNPGPFSFVSWQNGTFGTFNYTAEINESQNILWNAPGFSPVTNGNWVLGTATPSAAAVPEIDPNSLGSVLALVVGSLGLLERRRLKAA
jgi:hypothetical protein